MQINLAQSQPKSTSTRRPISVAKGWRIVLPFAVFACFLIGWQALVMIGDYPAFILPTPAKVADKFMRVVADGTLLRNTWITLLEVLGGLSIGVLIATALGYVLAKSVTIERAISPYLVASQAVPIIAIAPLLVLWFGSGMISKVLISALIVFFPILINTIAGVRGVSPELRSLMRVLNATHWQMFTKLEVPAAMPVLLAGLKVGATLSVIGAVVGEFTAPQAGLGVMISVADGQYDTARMFVGIFALIALALTLYGSVAMLERYALSWRK